MKRFCCVLLSLILICFASPRAKALSVSAKSAVLINGTTGEILWAKNSKERLPMASTTKIMTSLLLCETGDLETKLVTTKEMVTVEGSSMGLLAGDTVTYRDLLYGMMLASGNDAANTVAIALGGTVSDFVKQMNEKAAQIGLENTSFKTPSGLDAKGHYSTAEDMARLARYALKNEEFAKAAASDYAKLCYGNPPYNRTLKNHNKLLFQYDGAIGVKTGFTKKSGRCLVSAARRGNKYLIAVTLSAPNDWQDHKNMLDYGFSSLIDKQSPTPQMPPVYVVGGKREIVDVTTATQNFALTEEEWESLTYKIYLPQFVYAPVSVGDKLGRAEYIVNGEVIMSSDIVALHSSTENNDENIFSIIIKYYKMLLKAMV